MNYSLTIKTLLFLILVKMKNFIPKLCLLLCATLILITSCKKEDTPPTIPLVSTNQATDVSYNSVKCGGLITSDGNAQITDCGLCISDQAEPKIENSTVIKIEKTQTNILASTINSLKPSTTYYIRAFATNKIGTGYGEQISFKTLDLKSPVIKSVLATNITKNTASINVELQDDGGTQVKESGICWGTDPNLTNDDNKTSSSFSQNKITESLANLKCNTTYYVKAYAKNDIGITYSNITSFKTSPGEPSFSKIELIDKTETTLTVKVTLNNDGGAKISETGIWWGSKALPSVPVSDNYTAYSIANNFDGTSFTVKLEYLGPNITWYIKGYAKNSVGTGYSSELIAATDPYFREGAGVTDIDGNHYNTVIIKGQEWMKENLKTTKLNNGDNAWVMWYDNDEGKYKNTYGGLYTYETVNTNKLCPIGWRVPSAEDFKILLSVAGTGDNPERNAYLNLREKGKAHWNTDDINITDRYGFSGLPGGDNYWDGGKFKYLGEKGWFWTTTSSNIKNYEDIYMNAFCLDIIGPRAYLDVYIDKLQFISVRCIKN